MPNPGKGGWAFIVVDSTQTTVLHQDGGYDPNSTNNRMELTAIIKAIEYVKMFNIQSIRIHSDSQLSINCATGVWKRKLNMDLWEVYDSVAKNMRIEYVKVLAHSTDKFNNAVDLLAKKQIK